MDQPIWTTEELFPAISLRDSIVSSVAGRLNALPEVNAVFHFGQQVAPVTDVVIDELRALIRE